MRRSIAAWTGAWLVFGMVGLTSTACRAEVDFLAQFFGKFDTPAVASPKNDAASTKPRFRPRKRVRAERRPRVYIVTPRSDSGPSQAFCVRTCDGRFFPVAAQGERAKGLSCGELCPASETSVYYGSTIGDAVGENGKRYSELPNAFKFRNELVAGCTCNGTTMGLATIKPENDPTLRKGDIVAVEDGLMVARGPDRRSSSFAFSPVSAEIRAKFQRPPIVASDEHVAHRSGTQSSIRR